jgi:metacaspase-1
MPRGMAVVVGVSEPGPGANWSGDRLDGVHPDVIAYVKLLKGQSFDVLPLENAAAKAEVVKQKILDAARELTSGDMFVFTFSGHGLEEIAKPGPGGDERRDQSLCHTDRRLIDDELGKIWPEFKPGVRIVVITDACHSGSSVRAAAIVRGSPLTVDFGIERSPEPVAGNIDGLKCSLLHMAACRDTEKAQDIIINGKFTRALTDAWNANIRASYDQLFGAILSSFPAGSSQKPLMTTYGWYQDFFRTQPAFNIQERWPPLTPLNLNIFG